jgi:hypothetical protein
MAACEHRPASLPALSTLIRDPFVRRAFERGERDDGASFVTPAPRAPVLAGGAAERVPA